MNRQTGFTLIEMLVAMALAAVLITVAVPSFQNLIRSNQVSATATNLIAALQLARNESLKRRVVVTACSRATPRTDPETCSGSTNWATGWLVFVDANNNGTFEAGDTLMRVEDSAPGNPTIVGSASNVRYGSSGLANAAATIQITPDGCVNTQERIITVTITGTTSVKEDACN